MKQDYVSHTGIVMAVSDGSLTIHTSEAASCEGCAVSVICNKDSKKDGESGETITLDIPDALRFKVGERIEAIASSGSTLRAAVWALIIPSVVFVAVIIGVRLAWPATGAWSVAIAFAALGLYDLFLYLNRRRMASRLSWTVRRLAHDEK